MCWADSNAVTLGHSRTSAAERRLLVAFITTSVFSLSVLVLLDAALNRARSAIEMCIPRSRRSSLLSLAGASRHAHFTRTIITTPVSKPDLRPASTPSSTAYHSNIPEIRGHCTHNNVTHHPPSTPTFDLFFSPS